MSLDLKIARAAHDLSLVQRALYRDETWAMRWGGQRVDASVTFTETGIIVRGTFLAACHLTPPPAEVEVEVGGEVAYVKALPYDPGDHGWTAVVTFRLVSLAEAPSS